MKARDLMTSDPFTVSPTDTVIRAAELMKNIGIGCLPVVDAESRVVVGIITDRDLTVRCLVRGHSAYCRVENYMTTAPLITVAPNDDETAVLERMERAQVRRVPVVSADGKLVGIIAQADIARKLGPAEPQTVDEMLERISAPSAV